MTKLICFVKQEAVLSVAAVLAVVSAFFVPPDGAYLGYIDYRTLAILFSLMTVMAGLRQQGVFDRMGRALLALTGGTLQLVLVLVGLCFFGSMFITNDVSLLTFVPFAFVVHGALGSVNHALLSFEALAARGAQVAQVVYNRWPGRGDARIDADTAGYLRRVAGGMFPGAAWLEMPVLEGV